MSTLSDSHRVHRLTDTDNPITLSSSSGIMNRFILLLSAWLVRGVFPGGAFAADDTEFFEQRIRPVLVRHCYECHSAAASQVRGGLRLDFRGGARTGGESGAAIVPGRPDNSLLLDALRYQSFEMPPAGKLPDRVIADFEQWIRKGATDPRDQAPSAEESAAESWREQFAARSRWWSLQPPRKDPPPQVTADAWSHEPVDRFVRSALDRAKLAPATSAEAEVLLRRLSLILTGLPPQAEQVPAFSTAFARNPNTALEALVDQLS